MEPAPDSRGSEGFLPVFRAVSPSRREGFRRGCPSPARPGEPVRARTVGTVISRALDRAGTGAAPTSYAITLLAVGVDGRIVQTLMRHGSLATTGRYLGVTAGQ